MKRFFTTLLTATLGISTTGCTVIFPAHHNSMAKDGEQFSVTTDTFTEDDQFNTDEKNIYSTNPSTDGQAESVLAGAAAPVIVGLAASSAEQVVTMTKEGLDREATLYASSMVIETALDSPLNKIDTLVIERLADGESASSLTIKIKTNKTGTDLYVQLIPETLIYNQSSTKVLDYYGNWYGWINTLYLAPIFFSYGDDINVTYTFDFMDGKKTKLASIPFHFNGVTLGNNKDESQVNFNTLPSPWVHIGSSDNAGSIYNLKVTINEVDQSSAPRLAQAAAQVLEDNKGTIKDAVKKAVEEELAEHAKPETGTNPDTGTNPAGQ